jgi:alpha-N-acetylglucosamine transferase
MWSFVEYEKQCWLDSDMLVLKNIDNVFDELEHPKYEIAAARGCRCNVIQQCSLTFFARIVSFQ